MIAATPFIAADPRPEGESGSRLHRLLDGLPRRAAAPCLFVDGRWHDYAALAAMIATWRARLASTGPAAGSTIALQADYSLDSVGLLLAAWAQGLIVALVPRSADPTPYLDDADAVGGFELSSGHAIRWQAHTPRRAPHPLVAALAADGEAGLVIFTSGSTGRPRGAVHGVERFLGKFDRPGRALRTLPFLQFDHVAGMDTLLYTLSAGGSLVVAARRDPPTICGLIETTGVEVLSTSPSFLRLLWASGAAAGRDLSSVKVVTYGSEPMDAATLQRVAQLFPQARLSQKYGTTELGAPRTVSRGDDSLWIRIEGEGVRAEVRDGLLWIRSESAFLGYLDEAGAPRQAGSWYCTGDLVEQDGPWIRVLGRGGELINVGGEKVVPAEVEAAILELDDVAAVAVSGQTHPLLGQVVTARVQLAPGADAASIETRVRRHCRARLPRHAVPVIVDLATESLTNDRQKVQRRRG
ncbi:MAG: fatty acid--CoA ligase family protein [Steroidobacteraceae bacterium]